MLKVRWLLVKVRTRGTAVLNVGKSERCVGRGTKRGDRGQCGDGVTEDGKVDRGVVVAVVVDGVRKPDVDRGCEELSDVDLHP